MPRIFTNELVPEIVFGPITLLNKGSDWVSVLTKSEWKRPKTWPRTMG
jgi:hypothetical protein